MGLLKAITSILVDDIHSMPAFQIPTSFLISTYAESPNLSFLEKWLLPASISR